MKSLESLFKVTANKKKKLNQPIVEVSVLVAKLYIGRVNLFVFSKIIIYITK